MINIEQACENIVNESMCIKKGESVLIITDKNKSNLSKHLYSVCKKITDTHLVDIPIGKINGEEPPAFVADEMKKYDAIIIMTTRSLTHTRSVREACRSGARIASMPGITEDMMKRTLNIDYKKLAKRTNKIREILDKGKEIKITSETGTDLRFSIDKRISEGLSGLIKKGECGNLPSGEAFIAPVEGTAEGKYIINGSILNFKIKEPITVIVKKGYAVEIFGKKEADILKKTLDKIKDKRSFNIAEFGIGTNDKADITGNILEDEKVLGTCHIAFGNNKNFGGNTDVPIHLDGIILKPTIYVDRMIIMKKGKLII